MFRRWRCMTFQRQMCQTPNVIRVTYNWVVATQTFFMYNPIFGEMISQYRRAHFFFQTDGLVGNPPI